MHIAGRAYSTGHGVSKATPKRNQIQALLTAARASGGKDQCQVRLTGIEQEY